MMNTEPLDCQVRYGFLLQRKQVACRGGHQILCVEHVHLRRRRFLGPVIIGFQLNLLEVMLSQFSYQPNFWSLGKIHDLLFLLYLSISLHMDILETTTLMIVIDHFCDVFGLANPRRKKAHVFLK